MGNQQGKQGVKRAQTQYPFDDTEKKSRTDWTAGVPLSPGKPQVQLSTRTQPQDENSVTDEINLTWAVPKDDGGFPITGYRIEMLDIQTNQWIEITFIEGFEPRCTLSNILYGIMYRFRVIAYNDAGPSEAGDPSDPVVIDVPGVQIAPYFVLMLNDTIALEHEKVEFKVKVLGTPKPTLQWYKDDMEVFCSERLDIREEEDGGSVVVKEVRLSDSGNIKCVATNILGRATSVGQLIIEASPRLDVPETYNEGLIFRFDEVIRLKIPLIAKPPPRITWFFDDEPICASEDVSIETSETLTSLRIGAAKRWHCGEFRVLAQNENGEDSASILVTVTAPPSPVGKPVVIDIAGTTCVLRWDPAQDDGGADVKHFIVEYFRDVWDVWLKAKTTKECQVSIEDLIPGSRYKFRIKAENAYGISDESEESDPFDVGGNQATEVRLLSPPTIHVSGDNIPASPRRKTWKEMTGTSQDGEWVDGSEEAWSPDRAPNLATTKQSWASTESNEDVLREGSAILKDLLTVKKLSRRVSSIESDGLPSMASVDIDDADSESSDLQKARKLYAELQAMSMESTGSTEDMPDLDAAAREFYNEIRALSIDTGGSIENILDNIGASSESLASLIPQDKREQLASFEMNLKQMIEEAKQLAASPGRSMESLHSEYRPETRSTRKSNSVVSQPESIVSVIEAVGSAHDISLKARSRERFEEDEPLPMSMRGRPIMRSGPRSVTPVYQDEIPPPLQEQDSVDEQEQAPPLEELEPPVRMPSPPRPPPVQKQTPPRAPGPRGKVINREPSVGSDRYEDIIVETRKRSISRGPGSRMGSRTSSTMDFRNSQSDFSSGGRLDLESIKNSTKNVSALDLDTKIVEKSQPMTPEIFRKPQTPEVQAPVPRVLPKPSPVKAAGMQAFDANQNATAPTLPVAPPKPKVPAKPDAFVELFPKNIPHWFVITYTYSVVLILILLIANSTPDGKLYIHFTAFWSLVLYFQLEDDQANDLLDSVVEGFLKK